MLSSLFLAVTIKPVLLVIIAILALQWVLAIVALMRLFKDKVPSPKCYIWNLFIVLGVFVGPISYLIISKANKSSKE